MNGYEVAARLREQPAFRHAPLIALTGYGQEEDRACSRQAGFDHPLVKPVEPEAIQGLLESLGGVAFRPRLPRSAGRLPGDSPGVAGTGDS